MRNNPCKGRETGCTADPAPGCSRCDHCRRIHNEREAARRKARRKAFACWVCGADAEETAPGVFACTCAVHASYRAARARASA